MTPAVEAAEHLYSSWNEAGLSVLSDRVDPGIELICDPLHPVESAMRGPAGWQRWVTRWDEHYEALHVTVDALVSVDDEHVLAFVSMSATPRGTASELSWAAVHLWTVREGRIAGWEPHLDLAAARRTLDA